MLYRTLARGGRRTFATRLADRYIYRIHNARHRGWRVTFTRPKLYTRLFSDSVYGGTRKALLKARRHRDSKLPVVRRALKRLRRQRAPYTKGPHTRDKRSNTGIPGVRYAVFYRYHYTKRGQRRGPYPHACYIATAGSRGDQQFASYGIHKYGHEKAYQLACRARQRGIDGLPMRT